MARKSDIGSIVTSLALDDAKFHQDYDKAARAVKSFSTKSNRYLAKAERGWKKLTKSINPLHMAIGGVAGATGLGYLIKKNLEAADSIAKTADTIGIGTDSLQEYRYMAERSGVAVDQLDKGLGAFVKRLGELKSGTGALNTYLNKNNTALKDQLIATKSTDEALDIFLESLAGITDQSEKAALSAAAFSRTAGIKMTNMTKGGISSLKEMKKEFAALGVTIDEKWLRKSEEAIDRFTDLEYVLKGRLLETIVQMTPEIIEMTEGFTEWIVQNDRLIKQDLPTIIKGIATSVSILGKAIGKIPDLSESLAGFFYGPLDVTDRLGEKLDKVQQKIKEIEKQDKSGAYDETLQKLKYQETILQNAIEQSKKKNDAIKDQNTNLGIQLGAHTGIGAQISGGVEISKELTEEMRRQNEEARKRLEKDKEWAALQLKIKAESFDYNVLPASIGKATQAVNDIFYSGYMAPAGIGKYFDQVALSVNKSSEEMSGFDRALKNIHITTDDVVEAGLTTAFDGVASALTDWITGAESFEDAFKSMASSVLSDLAEMIIKQEMYNALVGQSYASGESSSLGGILGWLFHSGGTVGGSGGSARQVPAETFIGAPRFHGGLASDEMAAILKKGETVLTQDQASAVSSRLSQGSAVSVKIDNKTSSKASTTGEPEWDGGRWVLGVILEEGIQNNKMGFRNTLKAGLK